MVRWWWATAALGGLRLLLAIGAPLGDDEGYYWVWSRHLAAGYHDHPGMVAWLVAASTRVLGDSLFSLRAPFVLLGTLTALALLRLVEEVTGNARLARRSALLYQLVPVYFALGFLVIPDAPLHFFWLLGALAAWRALRAGAGALGLETGAAFGAALVSKYVGVLLPASLAGFAIFHGRRRALPALLAAGVVAILLFAPVILWNAQHGWGSFRFQMVARHHVEGFDLGRMSLFLASQVLYLSPLLFAGVVCAALRLGPWRLRGPADGERFLWWLAAPTLALFLVASALTGFKPNWPAPGYLTSIPLVLIGWERWSEHSGRAARWMHGATLGFLVLFVALPAAHLLHPFVPLPRGADPSADARGWREAARAAQRARVWLATGAAPSGAPPFFAAGRYQNAARLEFHLPGHPEVVCLNPARDAYDAWQDLAALRGRDFVFVSSDRYSRPPQDLATVGETRVFARIDSPAGPHAVHTITVYACREYGGPLAEPSD